MEPRINTKGPSLQDTKSENGTDRYPIASVVYRQSDTHNVCNVASMPTIGTQKKIYFWLRLGRMFTALEQKKKITSYTSWTHKIRF